jgi:hypothetical protein
MVKGVLHIHSRHSDGEFSLAELRDIYIDAGCRFACITDHADWFDEERLAAYQRDCEDHSDERFRFIPGLEYTCADRMHILGYGVSTLISSIDPEKVVARITDLGGIAVIAHPRDSAFAGIERFDVLPDGIEVWNSKYDGRYAPRPATFALLERLRLRRPAMGAFYGQDLHWRRQFRGLLTVLSGDAWDRHAVLTDLRRGDYAGVKEGLRLPSDGVLDPALLARFERQHERSRSLRLLIKRAKGSADRLGLTVPSSIKAQLRRIF